MADRQLTLGVQTDEATIANAKKRLGELQRAQERLAQAQVKYANDASKAGKAINEGITKQSRELEKEQKRLQRALENTNAAFIEQQSAAARAAKGIEAAQAASQERRGGPEEVLSGGKQLASIGRNIRNLPSVQVPGLGIGTDTFGRGAEVAGKLGVSLGQLAVAGGLAGAAIGALALVIKLLGNNAKDQALVLGAVADANREVGQKLAEGLTSDQANKRLEEIARLREEETKNLDRNKGALEDAQKQFAQLFYNVNSGTDGLSNAVLGLAPQTQELNKQITTGTANIAAYNTEEAALIAARDDGTLAANDAAKAEAELAAQRTASILREAEQAGTLAELKARANDLTKEQIDSELKALDVRRAGLEAELAALEASGDKTPEVTKKIDELRESLSFLGEQADVLKNAQKTAKSSEAEKAAEKAAKEAEKAEKDRLREVEKAQDSAAKAQQNYTNAVEDANQKFQDATEDIGRNLKDTLIDNQQDLVDDLNEMSLEFNQNELKEQREFERDLARIKRDAEDAELDATRQRDFAAARDARESAAKATRDRREDEAAENDEQLIELQQDRQARQHERDLANRDAELDAKRARRDADIARKRALRDAQASYQDALQLQNNFGSQFVRGFQTMFDSVLQMQSQMTAGVGSTSSGRPTSTAPRPSSSNFENNMQYMIGNPR